MSRFEIFRSRRSSLYDLGLLGLRLVAGGLMAGHGAQKLFGSFQGPGLDGTAGWLESIGLRPGRPWALAAGLSELGGGLLTALGFLSPLGPLGIIGAMSMAWAKAHAGKPIWATSGGAELPATNLAIASALILTGPGRFSLDEALGTELPRWLVIPGLLTVGATVSYAVRSSQAKQEVPLQAGEKEASLH